MESLAGQLTFYKKDTPSRMWSGYLRGSPTKYRHEDGEVIAAAIREAAANPVARPVDPKKLERPSNLYRLRAKSGDREIDTVVSVPSPEDEDAGDEIPERQEGPTHTEIQWRLLDLGLQRGLQVWAPKSDREKSWNARRVGGVNRLLDKLPTQFNAATNKTIENIDVLWLTGQTIVAAFEVEHSTSIYSGLLRMSDLLTMQPNLDIKLSLVGPDERFLKFKREIARPTFATRTKPLHSVCRFMPYSILCKRLEEAKNVIKFLRPEFIDEIAELYDPAEEVDV
jgi:hypothetical protein